MGNLHPVLVTILASHLQVEGVTWKPSMASLVGSVGKASWGGGKNHAVSSRGFSLPMDFDTSSNVMYLEGDG